MIKFDVMQENGSNVLKFFPVPVLIAFVLGLIGNGVILNEDLFPFEIVEVIAWLMMGFFFYVWVSLHQHSLTRKSIMIAYVVATVLWVYMGFEIFVSNHHEELVFFKSFFLTLGFILAFIYVPFLKQRDNNLKILVQVHQLRYALFGSAPFAFLFGGALLIIASTLNFLFDIELATLWGLIAFNTILGIFLYIFFTTLIINPQNIEIDPSYYAVNRYLLGLLYAFTIIIFTALNLFVVKIMITQTLPKGQIAWMVMGFSFFAFLSYLSLLPYKAKIKKYNTLLWGTLIVQSLVLLASISIRVYEYGVTEKRYLLVAYGLWLLAISIYFVWKKTEAKIFWFFATLSMVIFLSQVGFLSGYSVSKYSQQSRLEVLYANMKTAQTEEKEKHLRELYDVYYYLKKYHGESSVQAIMPELHEKSVSSYEELHQVLGLSKPVKVKRPKRDHYYNGEKSKDFNLKGYNYLLHNVALKSYPSEYTLESKHHLQFHYDIKKVLVRVIFDDTVLEADLQPLLETIKEEEIDKEDLVLTLSNEAIDIRFEFFKLRYYAQYKSVTGSADMFIGLKDKK